MINLIKKLGAFAAFAAIAFGPTAAACNIDIATRSKMVAPFVEATKPCLSELPEGFRWDYAAEKLHFDKINEARAAAGVAPLKLRYETKDAARFMSLDMGLNEFFDHVGPDERGVTDRVAAFDRRAIVNFVAENIAQTTTNIDNWELDEAPAKLHVALMKSPGHRRNILSEKATHVSIGILRSKRGVWVTQVFMGLSGTLSDDLPLRIEAGDEIGVKPYISDWQFKDFAGERLTGQKVPFETEGGSTRITRGLTGDINLLIMSEQKEEKVYRANGQTVEATITTSFIGPAFTIGASPS